MYIYIEREGERERERERGGERERESYECCFFSKSPPPNRASAPLVVLWRRKRRHARLRIAVKLHAVAYGPKGTRGTCHGRVRAGAGRLHPGRAAQVASHEPAGVKRRRGDEQAGGGEHARGSSAHSTPCGATSMQYARCEYAHLCRCCFSSLCLCVLGPGAVFLCEHAEAGREYGGRVSSRAPITLGQECTANTSS